MDIDAITAIYFEADRESVHRRYLQLFGRVDPDNVDTDTDRSPQIVSEVNASEDQDSINPKMKNGKSSDEVWLDREFRNTVNDWRFSDYVSKPLLEKWDHSTLENKAVVDECFMTLLQPNFRSDECVEILVQFYGVPVASRMLHALYPERFFPVDPEISYLKL
ncbi:hypothetical protein AB1L42_22910 [Thalassoglobus sp. JC818]|uniref:hypothetical protein n=1 Tax=Thalassoglobus sp. JC818 TaxID=3232136 RepID=UPI00345AB5C5